MNIAIMGRGQVGEALATASRRVGHQVTFGVRSPRTGIPDEATMAEAAGSAEMVILAVPYEAVPAVIAASGGLAGRIVIDATNPLTMKEGGLSLSLGFETSGAEGIATLAPRAAVFKTFNQTGFANMAGADAFAARPVMFVAGDDDAAKPRVLRLVTEIGFEAVDCGGLHQARLLEPLAMLWIDLANRQGLGRDFVFTLQRR